VLDRAKAAVNFRILDALDILLVALLLYQGYKLVANTRALNLVRGLLVFAAMWGLANWLELRAVGFILSQLATVGLFTIVVVFQPELRAVLERLGRPRVREPEPAALVLGEISRAVERLAATKTGALIALERNTPLGEHAGTGVKLDSEVTASMLETIFARNTPLHDGGVIVHHGRLVAAGCVFPLHTPADAVYRYGTRHRAALGLSEVSDALIVVVSEERGTIRVAENGRLSNDLTVLELRDRLRAILDDHSGLRSIDWSVLLARSSKNTGKETSVQSATATNTPSGTALSTALSTESDRDIKHENEVRIGAD
jgi:diadenylate cyclase